MADDLKSAPKPHDASHEEPMGRATFTAFTNATQDDWMKIVAANSVFTKSHVDRIVTHLNLLKGDCGGFAIDRLEHSLQTATRAHQAGEDEEYVVCALLHDIGDILGPRNHADIAAAIEALSQATSASLPRRVVSAPRAASVRCWARSSGAGCRSM